jgi:hypothetical protein
MKLIESYKGKYALEVALEVLHKESRDWISEIDFRKDELRFLNNFLVSHSLKVKKQEDKQQLEHLQNKFIYYQGEVLDEMRHDIAQHEGILAEIMHKTSNDEKQYRQSHIDILDRLHSFEKTFRTLKKEFIQFAEEVLLVN